MISDENSESKPLQQNNDPKPKRILTDSDIQELISFFQRNSLADLQFACGPSANVVWIFDFGTVGDEPSASVRLHPLGRSLKF